MKFKYHIAINFDPLCYISLVLFESIGGCDVHMRLCDIATDSGGHSSGEESGWPAQLPLSHQRCAQAHTREEMVSWHQRKEIRRITVALSQIFNAFLHVIASQV